MIKVVFNFKCIYTYALMHVLHAIFFFNNLLIIYIFIIKTFILYMPDYELVIASNLQKSPYCFELSLFGMEYFGNPYE